MVSPIIAMWMTLNYFSLPPSDIKVATRISACLEDISAWISSYHLKLNLDKTELLFLSGKARLLQILSITVANSTMFPFQNAKILGVTSG